jgi:hypothetical protein
MVSLAASPKRGTAFFAAVYCFVLLQNTFLLRAQAPTGEIRIEVKDPSGAAVNASGTLQNLSTGVTQRFETASGGGYTLRALPFGRYRLEVAKTGFATQSSRIDIQSATRIAGLRHDARRAGI